MKAASESMSLRCWFLKKPDWLDHQTAVGLAFAVKTFAASLLALYIAFWAGLDDPRWSFLTVYIVSQPDSGLVLAKGFYRILGTMAGLIVSIALVFGLAQYGELFVAATAAWVCFCNFAARAARNFESYGFQLAGYTVAIVGIPAALEPAAAYPLVVARFTEILLGIICAALVSRLILPRELSPKLVERVRALARRADSLATVPLDSDADRERVAAAIDFAGFSLFPWGAPTPAHEAGTSCTLRKWVFEHQLSEVRAGMVASEDPTNPWRSPYMPDVLEMTF